MIFPSFQGSDLSLIPRKTLLVFSFHKVVDSQRQCSNLLRARFARTGLKYRVVINLENLGDDNRDGKLQILWPAYDETILPAVRTTSDADKQNINTQINKQNKHGHKVNIRQNLQPQEILF
jgi:hypothetical protein